MSNDDFHTYESLFDLVSAGDWTAAYYLCMRYIVAACITVVGISLVCCGGCSIFLVVWKSITLTCWCMTCGRCCGDAPEKEKKKKKKKQKADDDDDDDDDDEAEDEDDDEAEDEDDDADATAIERDL